MVEKITCMSFVELMHRTVLGPLNMTRSWYGALPHGETNFARAFLTTQTPAEVERGYNILPELVAAGLWTTPTDLLKAISAIQDSLYSDTGGFLKQETAKLMLTKVSDVGWAGDVGMGWWFNDVAFGHGGDNDPGYCCWVGGLYGNDDSGAQSRNGIAIMTNSALGHEMCVRQTIAAIMYAQGWSGGSGKDGAVWLPHVRDAFIPYPAPASIAVDESWKAWKGNWEGGWEILEQDGVPVLKFEGSPALKLRPAAAPVKVFLRVGGGRFGLLLRDCILA